MTGQIISQAQVNLKMSLWQVEADSIKSSDLYVWLLEEEIREVESKEQASHIKNNDKTKFHIFLKQPLKTGMISSKDARDLMTAVETGQIPLTEAYQLVWDIINSAKVVPQNGAGNV